MTESSLDLVLFSKPVPRTTILSMTYNRYLRDRLIRLARSPGHLARKSYRAVKAYGHHEPSLRRLKRIVEHLLCPEADNTSSCPPASARAPAEEEDRSGLLARTTAICADWIKRKIGLVDPGDDEDEDEESELEARFTPLLDSINLDGLTEYACSIRRLTNLNEEDKAISLECKIGLCPMFGSFHVLFPVIFSDGLEWLLKVPAAGHSGSWNESAARSIGSEAMTMKFLNENTTIPVPAVYAFDSSLDGPFRCPFILMERIDGRPLYESMLPYFSFSFLLVSQSIILTFKPLTEWYTGFDSPEIQEKFRERALESIAAAMVQLQLSTSQYAQLGAPSPGQDAALQIVEPLRVYDARAMHKTMFSEETSSEPLFCDIGPYNTATDYHLSLLGKHRPHTDSVEKGVCELLRMFVQWTYHNSQRNKTFVLCHPDFNLQNILVAEDGTLKGLVDWDGVSTVPQPLGCPFPKWLTLDWDPANYNYHYDMEDCCRRVRHHSPGEMKHYRTRYAHFVHEAASKVETSMLSMVNIADATRKSVLAGSLDQAVKDPLSTAEIVIGIFDRITHITSQNRFKLCDGVRKTTTKEDCVDTVKKTKIDSATSESSSSDGSSDHSDSCFSDTSGASSQSTASTGTSSEKAQEPDNHQQVLNLTLKSTQQSSDLSLGSTRHNAKPEMEPFIEECGLGKDERKTELWYRVPSLLRRASHCLQLKTNRIRNIKPGHTGASEVSVEVEGLQFDVENPVAAAPACSSSMDSQVWVQPSHVEATGQLAVEDCHTASEDASVPMNNDFNLSFPLSTSGEGEQGEQEACVSPSIEPSTSQMRRKINLRQRVKAKLTRHKTKTTKGSHVGPSNVSEASEDVCGPPWISPALNRMITWMEKITHNHPRITERHDTAVTLHSVLPKIPRVSQFQVPYLETPDSAHSIVDMTATSNNLNGRSNTEIQSFEGGVQESALHDLDEPVDYGKLREEGFLLSQICDALMDGTLDKSRTQRLQQGFAALLDSL